MQFRPRLQTMTQYLLPLMAIVLVAAIFVADTITDLEIAVPVFYTAVILISVRFCSRRGLVLVGLGCVALTLLSDFLTPESSSSETGIINTIISILAIIATTALVLRIDSAERAVYDARAQLAHVARVTALGELTASIAHEVNQPIAATVINGNASLRWLSADPPNLDEARVAIERIVKDANRAADVVGRVRKLARRAPAQKVLCDVNSVISEIITLTATELRKQYIALESSLSGDLEPIFADPVQLQQVMLNLILNSIDAMQGMPEGGRFLFIGSTKADSGGILVTVRDSGVGFEQAALDHIFDAFYTTKSGGMGLGLTVTRSIIEAHAGRIWVEPNNPRGAIFRFTLPPVTDEVKMPRAASLANKA